MIIFIPRESRNGETRVAASADTVKKLVGYGFEVHVEKAAGRLSSISDDDYRNAGAKTGIEKSAACADIILKVLRPTPGESGKYKKGAIVLAMMDPHGNEAEIAAMAKAGLTSLAMELMPRITRAQAMDVLSSQANLAGYQAVIEASAHYGRAVPMMMTAAGTVPAARCFVMGAGVAGLQAIATARRLGAVVTATDVRPAAKEQVESLGAKFIAIQDDEFRQAETAGGYARQMSPAYQEKQAELVATHIIRQDMVITTALVPGRTAPRLVSKKMIKSMKNGAVIVDLAVERGGNVEGAKAGEIVTIEGVSIVGHLNMAGRIAATASGLYAKNLITFLETMIDKESGEFALDLEDELVTETLLTNDGKIVHPHFADKNDSDKSGDPK